MTKSKKAKNRRHSGLLLTAAVALMYIVVLLSALFIEVSNTKQRVHAQAESVLLDSAAEQARTLYHTLDGQFTILEVLAGNLGSTGTLDPDQIVPALGMAERQLLFYHVILDLPDGTSYLSDGQRTNVKERLYFQQSMMGARCIEYVNEGLLAGSPLVILSVPIWHEQRVIGVIHGSYKEQDIRDLTISEVYDSQGCSFICDDQGDMIVWPSINASVTDYKNFFDCLSDGAAADIVSHVQDDMNAHRPGKVIYGGQYAVYAPLEVLTTEMRRCYIVNELPVNVIDRDISKSAATSLITISMITAAAVLAVAFCVWREALNKKKLDKELDELAIREQQYRIVARQGKKNIYRYDIKTHVTIRDIGDDDGFGKPQRIENVPESIMDLFAEESREEYLEFYKKIRSGEPTATVVSRMRNIQGVWRWIRSDATVIYDAEGEPMQAIISYYDVTEQREKELLYQRWQQEKAALPKEEATFLECNLSHDTTDHINGDLLDWACKDASIAFNKRMRDHARLIVPGDRAVFMTTMNREWLIGAFYNGKYSHSIDYRIHKGGELLWLNITVQLTQYPDTNDIKAFLIVRNIDEQKRKEMQRKTVLERDDMFSVK